MVQDDPFAQPVESPRTRPPTVRDSLVLALAIGVFGATFGVLASESGLSVARTCAMSLLVFTGASQFAAVSVVGAGGGTVAAVASALLLAARNGVYGLALAPGLRVRGARRVAASQFVIDESTAIALAQRDDVALTRMFWWTGLSIFVCWNIGTLAGAVAGNVIGDPGALGLDAAFPAAFVALIAPQLRDRAKLAAAVGGAGVAFAAIPLARAGVPVLLAGFAALGVFLATRRAHPGDRASGP
jgi:4-azaleucine resistance transporter AzlC